MCLYFISATATWELNNFAFHIVSKYIKNLCYDRCIFHAIIHVRNSNVTSIV